MTIITFINGMERFNGHVWTEVEARIATLAPDVELRRFHDGHVDAQDPALVTAIAAADVIFISLINMRGAANWLAAQIGAAAPKAVFAYESMPEVMALNKVGDYRVTGGGRSAMPKPMQALLQLMTRGRDEDALYAYTKLTRVATRLLPLMPPKLKDFRTWLEVNIAWNQPDAENIGRMITIILRDCLGRSIEVGQLKPIPTMGCFHPDAEATFADPRAYLKWLDSRAKAANVKPGTRPLVALIAFRKHIVQGQQYQGQLIRALEANGMDVLPIFVSGIELHVAVREWLTPAMLGKRGVDLLINSMGFPLVGGPAGSTNPGKYREQASELLGNLDVPYMVTQPLQMQSEEHWHAHGVAAMQAVIMYDLPEMDGSIAPVALGAIRGQEIVATPDRLARAAAQAAGWTRLRRTASSERRVAFVLYNYPPGLGKLGTAALLDVPASLHAVLARMAADGYVVGAIPSDAAALAQQIDALEDQPPAQTYAVAEYRRALPANQLDRIERNWGAAPGDIAPAGRDAFRIDGIAQGNIFIGIQPPMGVPGDPMRLLFDRNFTPHHQYVAFYRYLRDVFRADAIVHVGMHGTAEWMPGLQLGLTADCWPDLLLGDLPQLYLYPLNNPSEAAIAKRRGYATTISHLVPSYARAGLYKQLAITRAQLDTPAPDAIAALPDLPRAADESDAAYRDRLSSYLDTLEQRLILDGLHIFGKPPAPARAAALIESALDVPRTSQPALSQLLADLGIASTDLRAARSAFVRHAIIGEPGELPGALDAQHPTLAAHRAAGRAIVQGLAAAPGEIDALLHGLSGGYIHPAAGADPVRAGASALPSGRNIHGIDPWRLPSETALARGAAMAAQLLARHAAAHPDAPYPRTVALPLWALDTIKSEGESIGVALALVGARPERDGQGKIWRYELVPLAELNRPRIDLLLDISSIFRDTFQMSLDLLDDMFRRAAAADEPDDTNFIRQHAQQLQAAGHSWEHATARIFTQAPGKYGTGVDALIDESAWDDPAQLADMFVQRSGHTYGGGRAGAEAPAILRGVLGTVDHVFQAIDSVEFGLTDMQHYYGHSGAIQLAAARVQGSSAIPLSYAESYTGTVSVAGADELIRIEARTKLLNPRWHEAMLAHGFAGAAEIGNRFTYLLGWSATTAQVDGWIFDQAAETFVLDDVMRARLETANPRAARNAVSRLLEANSRGLWAADETTIDRLRAIYGNLEDRLEGVAV